MKEKLERIWDDFTEEIASIEQSQALEQLRVLYTGKKGRLTLLLRETGKLDPQERPMAGKLVNSVREKIDKILQEKQKSFRQRDLNARIEKEWIDVSIPVSFQKVGRLHPITQVRREMENIFRAMGFSVAQGPEVETVFHNFDALNAPAHHPSRERSDTFYISDTLLLRTQTSPVQVRTLIQHKREAGENPLRPIRIISPGRCFRYDTPDATHSPMFYQMEGLVVDQGITFANLRYVLEEFCQRFFGEGTQVKFRPHNFPFTEPSAEIDITCFKCQGAGCPTCKEEGWIEILGAGMVHPQVLRNCGIDPAIYSGFAFGMGIDRITMAKFAIDDIRYLYENDERFLSQF